jgi:hypothetical protein
MDRRLLIAAVIAAALPAVALAAGGEKKKTSGNNNYVQMDPLLGTTVRGSGRRGVLAVDCGLDVPDPVLRTLAQQSVPRLRAAYVQTIQSYAAGLGPTALPNADYIASTLQRQTDTILGRRGARVLLGGIIAN